MNTFNIHRFLQTVKWTELTLLVHHIRLTVGVTLGFLGCAVGLFLTFLDDADGNSAQSMERVGVTVLLVVCALLISYGALVVADMKRKQDCIYLLTLPASNAEKFWARVLHCTVGVALCCFVALVCADVLQALLCLALRTPVASLTVGTFSAVVSALQVEDTLDIAFTTLLALFLLWMQSVYLLGGMFFRKRQWWLVTVIGVIVTGLVITAITFGSLSLAESGAFDGYVLDLYASAFIVGVVLVAFIVLNYWLAYKIFTRIQLINNKWVNV